MNTNIFYLDNSVFGNPKFSSKVNALFRVFVPMITVLYLAFVQCNENSLTLKHKYFEKSISIPWQNIRSIQFSGSHFIIKISDSICEEVKFKAPLETYLDIRNYLKDQAGHLTKFEE